MINITDVVREILELDDTARTAMQRGLINYSSYARAIKSKVEDLCYKEVDEKSIVVSLSRISKEFSPKEQPQNIKLLNLSVHSDLEEISYTRTKESISKIKELYKLIPDDLETFFTTTQSISEITVIGAKDIIDEVKKLFKELEPTYNSTKLSGVTVKFPLKYLDVPNVIFEISKSIARKKINIIEQVSTTTELTFIINKKDTELAVSQLSKLL